MKKLPDLGKEAFLFLGWGRLEVPGLAELLQQFFLLATKGFGRPDIYVYQQVAGPIAVDVGQAFAPEPEYFAGLGTGVDLDTDISVEGGHLDMGSQSGIGKAHEEFMDEVVPIPFEEIGRFFLDLNDEVPCGAAPHTCVAFALEAEVHAFCYARRDFYHYHIFLFYAAFAFTNLTDFGDDTAFPLTGGTGRHDDLLEKAPSSLLPDFAGALAGRAGGESSTIFCAGTRAGITADKARDFDFFLYAIGDLLQGEGHLDADI